MSYPDWKIHGEETLAAYLPDRDFRGILEKRMAIAPDHLAILIRDGEIIEAKMGMHLAVGGVWQGLKSVIAGRHALRLLVADLKPFPISARLQAFTKDKVEICAEVAMELQLNPERPLEVMGLVANNRTLLKADVYKRIRPHISERILVAEMVQHQADQLRANAGLQDRLQAEMMKEIERVVGDLGLMVRAVSVNFGLSDEERQAIEMRDVQRADAWEDFQHERLKRELERQGEATSFQLKTDHDITKLESMNEHELEKLLLDQSIEIADTRDTAARFRETKDLHHELELARDRRLALYDERIGDEGNALEVKKLEIERKKIEVAFKADERKVELDLKRLEREMTIELQSKEDAADIEKLGSLSDLEERKKDAAHGRKKDEFLTKHEAKMEKKRLEHEAEMDRLGTQAAMTPDQLLAIQAGLSPAVASVFAERAKAEASTGEEREALLRELVALSEKHKEQSEDQARAMFDKALDRIADVGAAGAGHHHHGHGGPGHQGEVSECPECHDQVPHSDRFCKNCGHQMRT